jgi:hypothetical protein
VISNQGDIFGVSDPIRYGDKRIRRNLFLPKYLHKASLDIRLQDEAYKQAYEIICRWADLDSSGKLEDKKETTLEGEFITEVFGKALGYTLFSENEKQWNIQQKYFVNGGEADAAIGLFEQNQKNPPVALIELKGPKANLDRDRFNGRTAVQQCWDYLNAVPDCPWGIVSNYVSFRLYNRNHTPREYQLFVLQDLKKEDVFQQFYYLFQKGALLPIAPGRLPRAERLLLETGERQQEVGDELYKNYHSNRMALIHHLTKPPHDKPLEKAIRVAQKIMDRIIFVAFCEDKGLLPSRTINKAYSQIPPFARVTNPRWRNFLDLFRSIDKGNKEHGISPFDGGLFRKDEEVDDLQLDDNWTNFFDSISRYDFRDEVNVDVLGHLFEKSVNAIERIRLGGLFDAEYKDDAKPKMKKSAERKKFGIYYTPPEFTSFITYKTIAKVIEQRFKEVAKKLGIKQKDIESPEPDAKLARYWDLCFNILRAIKIIDPACGSGAFLIKAYDIFEEKYNEVVDQLIFHDGKKAEQLKKQIPDFILQDNIYGVDLSPESVEITQLALWIRSADEGKTLSDLSKNVVCGNSLVDDTEVHPRAMDWQKQFPEIFSREKPGFDCVIGNPPWERMKLQEREFFDTIDINIASAVNASTRRKLIEKLKKAKPEIYERYLNEKQRAEKTLEYVRSSGRFPLTGKGDINTYAVFAELAHDIVSPIGKVGLLVPSGIATDNTTKDYFNELIVARSLAGLYDFENRKKIFPDIDSRMKFSILLFGGSENKSDIIDFVFFAHKMKELQDKNRHIQLSSDDIKVLNPNTRTCPIFRSQRDAEITKAIYRRVPVLVDKNREEGGNPWGIKFLRMFDQTNDAELFHEPEKLKKSGYKRHGPNWKKGKKVFLPLYEAKMIQMYDHRAAMVISKTDNWMRQGQTVATTDVQHQNPEYFADPRWWVDKTSIDNLIEEGHFEGYIAYKDVTSATNRRTMIAAFVPYCGMLNSAPIIFPDKSTSAIQKCCLLTNLNSLAYDYVARQKVGGVHLNFFIVEQLPTLHPDFYSMRCPWDRRQTLEKWISDKVLKLTCTSNDMIPLAEVAGFDPPVHKWDPVERADLMAQLDAAYFLFYGIDREDVEYILSTFSGLKKEEDGIFGASGTVAAILEYYDKFKERSKA